MACVTLRCDHPGRPRSTGDQEADYSAGVAHLKAVQADRLDRLDRSGLLSPVEVAELDRRAADAGRTWLPS